MMHTLDSLPQNEHTRHHILHRLRSRYEPMLFFINRLRASQAAFPSRVSPFSGL